MIFNLLYLLGHPLYLLFKFFFNSSSRLAVFIIKGIRHEIVGYKYLLKKIRLYLVKKRNSLILFTNNLKKPVFRPFLKRAPLPKKPKKTKLLSLRLSLLTPLHKVFHFFGLILRLLKLIFGFILDLFSRIFKNLYRLCVLVSNSLFRVSKKRLLLSFLLVIFLFIALDVFYLVSFLRALPPASSLKTRIPPLTTKIYDRNGKLLYKIYDQKQNRTLVTLDELPDYLKKATIAIEDKDFYKHGALSPLGIIRAFRQNLQGDKQGGSTITQQLVKNVLLTPERTLERKIKEVLIAVQAEMIFSKDEILTMYFNEVSYGGTAYGIEEAAQTYFGKSASNLDLAESTLLAGLPAAPTYYSPFGANPQKAVKRQLEVLRRMDEDGYISDKERYKVIAQKLNFAPQKIDIKAPHFVMFLKDLLVEKYGEKLIEQGGLSVISSLDLDLQNFTQNEVSLGVEKQKYLNVGNGSALVTNPQTGEILAMVGSVDYFDAENDGNVNVTLMPRQPGSAIKPVNYAAGFSLGKITPSTIVWDTPVVYTSLGSPPYSPQNYDGRFRGKVTARQALGSSLNVPAVKLLNNYGVLPMIEMGETLGITTWGQKDRFGLSLTLGGGEVKMVDMAEVFGTFANLGTRVKIQPILKVINYQGTVLEDNSEFFRNDDEPQGLKALAPGAAFLINSILADNNARSLIFGLNSALFIPGHTVSVKTGTTESKKDNWTIGYTKDLLTVVWIGNNDSSPMSPYLESGVSGAAPIWRKIMDELLKNKKDSPLEIPPDIIKMEICKETGLPSCGTCTKVPEYYLLGTQPQVICKNP